MAYKNEGFDMFTELMNSIWEEFARYIFVVELEVEQEQPEQAARQNWGGGTNTSSTSAFSYAGGTAAEQPSALAAARQAGNGQAVTEDYVGEYDEMQMPAQVVETRTVDHEKQVGRNDPCWCGSGKKFKKCHGA